MRRWVSLPLAVLVTLLSACGSGRSSALAGVDGPFGGYPSFVSSGTVQAEAYYDLDQASRLGGDLLESYGLVPVALRLGLASEGAGPATVVALPEDMALVLHLVDGTPLPRVAPEMLDFRRRRLGRLVQEGFEGGPLPSWEQAREGFVYFRLPAGVRADSRLMTVRRRVPGGERTLDLLDSVVRFELTIDGRTRELSVGLRADRRGARRSGEGE